MPRNWTQRVGKTSFSGARGHRGRGRGPERFQVAGARRLGGPRQKIVIEVMEDVEAPANVDGKPVKRLSELSKYEGEERAPKGSRSSTYTRPAHV